jgi:membrane protease YdiL (CAAX protease family)
LKDAARLIAYFAAILLLGACLAPPLFWSAQWLAAHQIVGSIASYDFESFFHRALLLASVVLLWPLLRWARVRQRSDLGIAPNEHWLRDLCFGFLIAAGPLLCCALLLVQLDVYSWRDSAPWNSVGGVALAALTVPIIEEMLFRGLFLGLLLRSASRLWSIIIVSAFFSILHFLKSPESGIAVDAVRWNSGFSSAAAAFGQFGDPLLVLAGFTTLFVLGCILADARVQTRSLWLPMGLHAGWILVSGVFNKMAHRDVLALPWLGKNLLVGIVPLTIALASWALLRGWLKYVGLRET